jgi:hemerythrin
MNPESIGTISPSEIPQTGIGEIDAQHSRLVELYNRLHEWMQRGHATSATFDALTALETYVVEHFAFEEKFLEQIGFAEIDEHRARHRELVRELERHKQALFDGEDVANQLLGFVSNWIKTHTADEDMKYVLHYQQAKGDC